MVDQLGLEVGYRLIPLVDHAQNGELLHRIRSLRKKFAQDVGFAARGPYPRQPRTQAQRLPHPAVWRKWPWRGHARPMAGDRPGRRDHADQGTPTTDPAFGLPALWIDGALRDQAQVAGYTVVDAGTVVATHLNHRCTATAPACWAARSAAAARAHRPRLAQAGRGPGAQDAVAHRAAEVLQGLLAEEVPIRDMRTIIDTLSEHGSAPCRAGGRHRWPARHPGTDRADPPLAGSRHHAAMVPLGEGELRVIGLDVKLERVLAQALTTSGGLEPGLADTFAARDACGAGAPGVARQRAGAAGCRSCARLCRASCGTTCRSWAFCRIRKYRMSAWSA